MKCFSVMCLIPSASMRWCSAAHHDDEKSSEKEHRIGYLQVIQFFTHVISLLQVLVVAFSSSLDVAAIEMELGLPLDYNRCSSPLYPTLLTAALPTGSAAVLTYPHMANRTRPAKPCTILSYPYIRDLSYPPGSCRP
jgi:hypothetical protein